MEFIPNLWLFQAWIAHNLPANPISAGNPITRSNVISYIENIGRETGFLSAFGQLYYGADSGLVCEVECRNQYHIELISILRISITVLFDHDSRDFSRQPDQYLII
jgi:hypothetical protein